MSFTFTMDTKLLGDIDFLEKNSTDIFNKTVLAGAEAAKDKIAANANKVFDSNLASSMNSKLKVTKAYQTRDGKINAKAAYYGYIATKKTKRGGRVKIRGYSYKYGVPAPLIAALREYGARSGGGMPTQLKNYWSKKPFIRPVVMNPAPIMDAMLAEEKKASGGLLNGR